MNRHRDSIKIIFDIEDWGLTLGDIEDRLFRMSQIIPDSDYYFDKVDPTSGNLKNHIKYAQKVAFAWEKIDRTLYLITDNPNCVHFFAMYPDYEELVQVLNKRVFRIPEFTPFSASDMISEERSMKFNEALEDSYRNSELRDFVRSWTSSSKKLDPMNQEFRNKLKKVKYDYKGPKDDPEFWKFYKKYFMPKDTKADT